MSNYAVQITRMSHSNKIRSAVIVNSQTGETIETDSNFLLLGLQSGAMKVDNLLLRQKDSLLDSDIVLTNYDKTDKIAMWQRTNGGIVRESFCIVTNGFAGVYEFLFWFPYEERAYKLYTTVSGLNAFLKEKMAYQKLTNEKFALKFFNAHQVKTRDSILKHRTRLQILRNHYFGVQSTGYDDFSDNGEKAEYNGVPAVPISSIEWAFNYELINRCGYQTEFIAERNKNGEFVLTDMYGKVPDYLHICTGIKEINIQKPLKGVKNREELRYINYKVRKYGAIKNGLANFSHLQEIIVTAAKGSIVDFYSRAVSLDVKAEDKDKNGIEYSIINEQLCLDNSLKLSDYKLGNEEVILVPRFNDKVESEFNNIAVQNSVICNGGITVRVKVIGGLQRIKFEGSNFEILIIGVEHSSL